VAEPRGAYVTPLVVQFGDCWLNPRSVQAVTAANAEGRCRVLLTCGSWLVVNMRKRNDERYVDGVGTFLRRLDEALRPPMTPANCESGESRD
jgi:hypothetical protein